MESAGIIAAIVTGTITITGAIVKMMDKNGFLCECRGCGCFCKVDGRKSETRQLELQNTKKQLELNGNKSRRFSIFNSSNKKNNIESRGVQTPSFTDTELKEDRIQSENLNCE